MPALMIPANLEKSEWPQDWKGQSSLQPQRKAIPKNVQITTRLYSSHTLVKFEIPQTRFQQYMNCELPDVQAGFRKAEELEIKMPIYVGSSKKIVSCRKISISALSTMPKFSLCGSQ